MDGGSNQQEDNNMENGDNINVDSSGIEEYDSDDEDDYDTLDNMNTLQKLKNNNPAVSTLYRFE